MQGGINNAALFGASQREARSKLDQMAGIKRPSGILASSAELMQAAMPAPMPAALAAPMPMAPPPAPMAPMAQPPMPNMPMNTTVAPMAPRPLNPMVATAAPAQPAQPVVKLNEGGEPLKGYSDMGARLAERAKAQVAAGGSSTVDITDPTLVFLEKLNKNTDGAVVKTFGSLEQGADVGKQKANIIESATAATDDPSKVADAVVVAAGEKPTDAAKKDFAENVFGMEDVNDIDEINRRIANVAIGSSVGKGPDKFAEAVLFGLQTYKQTASARAAAAAGGKSSGFEPLPRYAEALPDMVKTIMTNNPGITAQEAAQQAALVLDPLYNKAAGASSGTGASGDEKRITMYDPTGKPFYSTDGTNFVDADGKPYVPPTQE